MVRPEDGFVATCVAEKTPAQIESWCQSFVATSVAEKCRPGEFLSMKEFVATCVAEKSTIAGTG